MGLLDTFMPGNDPYGPNDSQRNTALITGLLSAGLGALTGRRGAPLNSIGRAGLLGLGGYQGALDSAANQNMRLAQLEESKQTGLLNRQNLEAQIAERQRLAERQKGVQDVIAGLQPTRTMLAGPMPDGMTLPPAQGQISPDMIAAALAQRGFADEAAKYAELNAKMAPKTQVIDGKVYQIGPNGLVDLGGPGEFKAPPMRTIKQGQREIQQELQRDGTWKEVGNAPLFKPDGPQKPERQYDAKLGGWVSSDGKFTPLVGPDGRPIANPTGLDTKAPDAASPAAKVQDAKDVLGILNEAEPLIKKSTGSYIGAGVDMAGRAIGMPTSGAVANAQLKVLSGSLVSKMPKMTGPQSDKDVQLYREMAGRIGDETVSADEKAAALTTIRQLNEKYLASQGQEIPPRPIVPAGTQLDRRATDKGVKRYNPMTGRIEG